MTIKIGLTINYELERFYHDLHGYFSIILRLTQLHELFILTKRIPEKFYNMHICSAV